MPDAVSVRRLMKLKAEQQQRLKTMRARVDRLAVQEERLWKDVTSIQRMSIKAQETQLHKRRLQAERGYAEKELLRREHSLRRQAEEQRCRQAAVLGHHKQVKLDENRAAAQQVRQDSQRLLSTLQQVRERAQQNKQMHVELQRHQHRQHRLKRELEQGQREQLRQAKLTATYAQLRDELMSVEQAVAVVEKQEVNAVLRLQNSQNVRANAVANLQSAKAFDHELLAQVGEATATYTPTRPWPPSLSSARCSSPEVYSIASAEVDIGLDLIEEEDESSGSLSSSIARAVEESMRDIGLQEFRKQLGLQEFRKESNSQASQHAHGSRCGDRRYRSASPPQTDSSRHSICGLPQTYRTCSGSPRKDQRRVLGPSNGGSAITSARATLCKRSLSGCLG